jgi:hypothetical protein
MYISQSFIRVKRYHRGQNKGYRFYDSKKCDYYESFEGQFIRSRLIIDAIIHETIQIY